MKEAVQDYLKSHTVLAFDCALAGISVGVSTREGHIASRQMETVRGQASLLIPTLQEILAEAETTLQDVDLIVSTVGPGSFTGLRIGLTTARTLGLALNVPVVGVSTLDVMAAHYNTNAPLLVVLETKRQDFYACLYDAHDAHRIPLSAPMARSATHIMAQMPDDKAFTVGGDCLARFQSALDIELAYEPEWIQFDPVIMIHQGVQEFLENGAKSNPEPLYLRGADVSQSKTPPRQLAQK